jgi:RND superfamily putative drug exporter
MAVAAILVLAAAGVGFGAPGKLQNGGFTDPGSPSELARTQLDASAAGQPNLVFLVTARTGTVDSPAAATAGRTLTQQVQAQPTVASATSYWSTGSPSLKSKSATHGPRSLIEPAASDKAMPGSRRSTHRPSGDRSFTC